MQYNRKRTGGKEDDRLKEVGSQILPRIVIRHSTTKRELRPQLQPENGRNDINTVNKEEMDDGVQPIMARVCDDVNSRTKAFLCSAIGTFK